MICFSRADPLTSINVMCVTFSDPSSKYEGMTATNLVTMLAVVNIMQAISLNWLGNRLVISETR